MSFITFSKVNRDLRKTIHKMIDKCTNTMNINALPPHKTHTLLINQRVKLDRLFIISNIFFEKKCINK
jgi:hypothetical protein